jgi:hypothetical protein
MAKQVRRTGPPECSCFLETSWSPGQQKGLTGWLFFAERCIDRAEDLENAKKIVASVDKPMHIHRIGCA